MNDAVDSPLLLYLDWDDKAFAANRNQLILHRSAFREPAQVTAQRFLNGALLLLDLAANAP